MSATAVIKQLQAFGCVLSLGEDGAGINFHPRSHPRSLTITGSVPYSFVPKVKAHKAAIIEILSAEIERKRQELASLVMAWREGCEYLSADPGRAKVSLHVYREMAEISARATDLVISLQSLDPSGGHQDALRQMEADTLEAERIMDAAKDRPPYAKTRG